MKKFIGIAAILFVMVCVFSSCSHEHEYDDWEITKEPTCTEAGEKVRSCECGAKESEVIPAKGHTVVVDPAVEATCIKTGLTKGEHCSVCGEVLKKQEEIGLTEHKEEVIPAVAPTCEETGLTAGKRCPVCHETLVEQETVSAVGHSEVDVAAVAATCLNSGNTKGKRCSKCHKTLEGIETTAALGHKFDKDGRCKRCDEAQTVISAKDLLAAPTFYSIKGYVKIDDVALSNIRFARKSFKTYMIKPGGGLDYDRSIEVFFRRCKNKSECLAVDAHDQRLTVYGYVYIYNDSPEPYIEAIKIVFN